MLEKSWCQYQDRCVHAKTVEQTHSECNSCVTHCNFEWKEGEVLQHNEGNFFVSFHGKQYGWFASRAGAETHLQMLRESVDV